MPLPANIQQHIFELLNKTSNVSFVSAERLDRTLGLTPGQMVAAEVKALLPYNRAQVSIGTALVNLELPISVRVGQSLELTFVADEPRPTFAMPRPGQASPPIRLTDASRLLALLLGNNQMSDPQVRSSLSSVSQLLHQVDGDNSLIATVLDEALTYSPQKSAVNSPSFSGSQSSPQKEQMLKSSFEQNAAQILQQVARNARFTMVEAVNQPLVPLPLMPGDEVNATITGTLPGGRVFVTVAGTALELQLPNAPPKDGILRLTFLSALPKPLFALQRNQQDLSPGSLSEASRWLSVLEHSPSGVSPQQMTVLERLNQIITALPPDSAAFSAIRDEAITYNELLKRPVADATSGPVQQSSVSGNGIVLHDDMAKLLQALIRGNRLALLEAINQQAVPIELMPGQQLKADVLAAMGGGRYMLDVAGMAMQFVLPKGIVVGNRLQLFFITSDPSPTFLLAIFGKATDSSVSQTGRWIGNLLENTGETTGSSPSAVIFKTLFGELPKNPELLSQALEKNLKGSGLFYESHLGRWFSGEYILDDILKEPQGMLSHLKQIATLPFGTETAKEQLFPPEMASEKGLLQSLHLGSGEVKSVETLVDSKTLPIIQEQLQTLQRGTLFFQGELFPGQQIRWQVQQREGERGKDGASNRSWQTSISLTLPHLGEVSADLQLNGTAVSVQLSTAKEDAYKKLQSGKEDLQEQFAAAGLLMTEVRISHEKE